MSFFQKVRTAFGLGTGAENPIDTLDGVLLEHTIAIHELNAAKVEFCEISEELDLKKKACDTLIAKGNVDGPFNKKVIENKIDTVTKDFLSTYKSIEAKLQEIEERRMVLEVDIVEKATEFVAMVEAPKQAYISDIMSDWMETGLIESEQIDSHAMAIVKALDTISDGFFYKGVAAQVGEERTWSGRKYKKTSNGWVEVLKPREKKKEDAKKEREKQEAEPEKKHSTQEIVAHAENTSTEQLKKVAGDESKDAHVRDAAKREIERRNADKDKEKRQWGREDKVRAEDREHDAKEKADEKRDKKADEKKKKEEAASKVKPGDRFSELMDFNSKTNDKRKHLLENHKSLDPQELDRIRSEVNTESEYFVAEMNKLGAVQEMKKTEAELAKPKKKKTKAQKEAAKLAKEKKDLLGGDFENYYTKMIAKHAEFSKLVHDVAAMVGGQPIVAPVKSLERSRDKVENVYGGDFSQLRDILRSTIILPDARSCEEKVLAVAAAYKDKVGRFYADFSSDGYQGANMHMDMGAAPVEIQFNTPINLALKDDFIQHPMIEKERQTLKEHGIAPGFGHKFYEQLRSMSKNSEKHKRLEAISNKYWSFRDYF